MFGAINALEGEREIRTTRVCHTLAARLVCRYLARVGIVIDYPRCRRGRLVKGRLPTKRARGTRLAEPT